MEQTVRDKILEIKKSLRLSMNGVVSSLQRKQGLDYKINFGVEIPRLKSIAAQYPKERALSLALWQENIRECKMLAIMLMPSEEFTTTDSNTWIAETPFTEIADHLAMQLLCRLPYAAQQAITWIESNEGLFSYCGFLTLSHLFRQGTRLDTDNEERYLTVAAEVLSQECNNRVLQTCAYASLQKFCALGNDCLNKVTSHKQMQHIFI